MERSGKVGVGMRFTGNVRLGTARSSTEENRNAGVAIQDKQSRFVSDDDDRFGFILALSSREKRRRGRS